MEPDAHKSIVKWAGTVLRNAARILLDSDLTLLASRAIGLGVFDLEKLNRESVRWAEKRGEGLFRERSLNGAPNTTYLVMDLQSRHFLLKKTRSHWKERMSEGEEAKTWTEL
jgi:hypothetical protein